MTLSSCKLVQVVHLSNVHPVPEHSTPVCIFMSFAASMLVLCFCLIFLTRARADAQIYSPRPKAPIQYRKFNDSCVNVDRHFAIDVG
jgi:hypothetical protein